MHFLKFIGKMLEINFAQKKDLGWGVGHLVCSLLVIGAISTMCLYPNNRGSHHFHSPLTDCLKDLGFTFFNKFLSFSSLAIAPVYVPA